MKKIKGVKSRRGIRKVLTIFEFAATNGAVEVLLQLPQPLACVKQTSRA